MCRALSITVGGGGQLYYWSVKETDIRDTGLTAYTNIVRLHAYSQYIHVHQYLRLLLSSEHTKTIKNHRQILKSCNSRNRQKCLVFHMPHSDISLQTYLFNNNLMHYSVHIRAYQ